MDSMTSNMCKFSVGRIGYARVLVDIDASKELPETVEVEYRNSLKEVICKKSIAIEYSWIPPRCCHYKVFGHSYESCSKHCEKKKSVNSGVGHNDDSVRKNEGIDDDGFRNVQHKKMQFNNKKPMNRQPPQQKKNNIDECYSMLWSQWVGKKSNNEKLAYQPKTTGKYMKNGNKKADDVNERVGKNDQEHNDASNKAKTSKLLGDIEEHELIELEDIREREKVDMFIIMKRKPIEDDMKDWNVNMCNYFKQRWKLLVDKGKYQLNMRCEDDDDVINETNGITKGMEDNEWVGTDMNILQDC
ncbi:zinc knuckle CX2CX4HX4C containing protein [Tanacetum coccineum]